MLDRMTARGALRAYFAEHVGARLPDEPHAPLADDRKRRKGPVDAERLLYAVKNLLPVFGDTALDDLDERDFEDYAEKRADGEVGRPAGDATVRREISLFRAAVNWQIAKRRLTSDKAPIFWLPDDTPVRCDKWLPRESIDFLAMMASERVSRFIMLAYFTAGRPRAVRHLEWDRVDFDKATIDLHPPEWRKTRKRNARVPIPTELMPALSEWRATSENRFVLGSKGSVRTAFSNAVDRAGLSDVTPHWLRHSRATHLLQSGASLWETAGILGDTVETIERTYGHHCPHHLRAVVG
jgi:integrase